jgi:hypothetical protein
VEEVPPAVETLRDVGTQHETVEEEKPKGGKKSAKKTSRADAFDRIEALSDLFRTAISVEQGIADKVATSNNQLTAASQERVEALQSFANTALTELRKILNGDESSSPSDT